MSSVEITPFCPTQSMVSTRLANLMWAPVTPTYADFISTPAWFWTSATATRIALAVASPSATMPFLSPLHGTMLYAKTSGSAEPSWTPTMTQTLVVPTSIAVISLGFAMCSLPLCRVVGFYGCFGVISFGQRAFERFCCGGWPPPHRMRAGPPFGSPVSTWGYARKRIAASPAGKHSRRPRGPGCA